MARSMRRIVVLLAVLLGALAVAIPASAQAPQSIRIESWLQALEGSDLTQGQVLACAKVSGAVNDTGGDPTWTDATYASTADLPGKCADWTAVGGYRFEGRGHLQPQNLGRLDHILFARHTIVLSKGTIDIQFTGRYYPDLLGDGQWVINGGTGEYAGLQGTGTWHANGQTFPFFMHTEVGTVHWTGR